MRQRNNVKAKLKQAGEKLVLACCLLLLLYYALQWSLLLGDFRLILFTYFIAKLIAPVACFLLL